MNLSDLTIKKIEHVLDDIVAQQTCDIYSEQNKEEFYKLIKDFCGDDEKAKEVLFTLVVNDVFIFLQNKDYLRLEKNVQSCLCSIGFEISDVNKIFKILKVAEEVKKLKMRQKLRKVLCSFAGSLLVVIPMSIFILDYCSYYRNSSEKLVKNGSFKILDTEYYVDSFFISEREVTVTDYEMVTGINALGRNSDTPVVNISWFDAIKYCNGLSEKNGLQNVYCIDPETNEVSADFSRNGYRLPTKVEWYWAAINPNENGSSDYSGANNMINEPIDLYCWYIKNSDGVVHNTCLKKKNKRNLYDMSGNVEEWCWDYYWDWKETKDGIQNNPTGPNDGIYRSVCGGFFGNSEKYINLINSQTKMKPENKELYCGFRVCRSYKKKVKLVEY